MKSIKLGKSNLLSSRIAYGCMRIVGDNNKESRKKGKLAVRTAIEAGFNHFDHADIYANGESEKLFGEVLQEMPGIREKLIITGKCGVIFPDNPKKGDPGRYNLSKEHILKSVDESLKRLKMDYLDLLLLHRPDFLFNAEEIAETFEILKDNSKVLNFGVSNFRTSQVSLLQSFCSMPLVANQIEINIHNVSSLIDGVLDQCQQQKITPLAWCPVGGVAYPAWRNTFSKEDEIRIDNEFEYQAKKYDTEKWIIMLAWLLKHPAEIVPIIGSTNSSRIKAAKHALDLDYSRIDWYRLWEARNGHPVV